MMKFPITCTSYVFEQDSGGLVLCHNTVISLETLRQCEALVLATLAMFLLRISTTKGKFEENDTPQNAWRPLIKGVPAHLAHPSRSPLAPGTPFPGTPFLELRRTFLDVIVVVIF